MHSLPPADAILSPGTALQATAEDFLEAVDAAPADALRDLVNFVLRCCGCNSSVDSDQVMDSDGIVDCIDEFTEAFKTVRFFHCRSLTAPIFLSVNLVDGRHQAMVMLQANGVILGDRPFNRNELCGFLFLWHWA